MSDGCRQLRSDTGCQLKARVQDIRGTACTRADPRAIRALSLLGTNLVEPLVYGHWARSIGAHVIDELRHELRGDVGRPQDIATTCECFELPPSRAVGDRFGLRPLHDVIAPNNEDLLPGVQRLRVTGECCGANGAAPLPLRLMVECGDDRFENAYPGLWWLRGGVDEVQIRRKGGGMTCCSSAAETRASMPHSLRKLYIAGRMGRMWSRWEVIEYYEEGASIGPSSLRWAAMRSPRSSNSVSSSPLRRARSSVSRTAVTQIFARSRSCPGASVVTRCCRGSRRSSRRRVALSANSRSRSTRALRNVRSATCGSRVRRLRTISRTPPGYASRTSVGMRRRR